MVFSLGQILSISCFLTGIVMAVFVLAILVTMRFGQQWLSALVERFTNPDRNKKKPSEEQRVAAPQQPQVASSQALRQRAQNLDFPAPAGGFAAQTANPQTGYGQAQTGYQQPAQATFRARDQYPEFNPQASQPQQQQGLQPTMPSLSPSRPFQAGNVLPPSQPQYPQQGGFSQQGGLQQTMRSPSAPQGGFQQQGRFQQQGIPPQQPQQGGLQPLRPQAPQQAQQGGFPQQPLAPRPPQNFPQQGGFQQQGIPTQQPQQGGLGDYRPPLSNAPRPDLRTQSQRPMRRDNRRQDTDEGGLLSSAEDLIDGAGDLLDSF
jgi:hypothetical protein